MKTNHMQRPNRWYLLVILASVATWATVGMPSSAQAEKVPNTGKAREHRKSDKISGREISLELAGSYQGLGAILRSRIGYKWRLYANKSAVLENNFFLLNGIAQVTPAYANIGAGFTLQPLSIFSINASYMYRIHFPTFTSGALFKDKEELNARYKGVNGFLDGDNRLDDQLAQVIKNNNGSRPFVTGHLISVGATFQIKLKGIIFAANGELLWNFFDYQDASNSGFLYEPFLDMVVAKQDMQFNLSLVGGYEWRNLLFLVVYSHSISFGAETQRALVGPGIRWEITKRAKALLKPYLLVLVRWYVLHQWRISPLPNIAFVLGTNF